MAESLIPSAEGSINLAPNPSFEQVTDTMPVAWTVWAPRDTIAPLVRSDRRVHRSGDRSLLFSGGGKAGVMGLVTTRCQGITAGDSYECSVYFRTEGIPSLHESVWARVSWLRHDGDDMPRNTVLHELTREGEWWRLSGRMQAPDGAGLAEVCLSLRHAPEGQVWFDDVALTRVSGSPSRQIRLATTHLPRERNNPEGCDWVLNLAGEGGADIVCLTEFTQIVASEDDHRPTVPGLATQALGEYARRHHMLIVASLPDWQGDLRYNTGVIIGREGELTGRYQKTHLPQGELEEGTSPGQTLPVFATDIGRIGLQICYDHFFPEVTRVLALRGAEIVFTSIMGDIRDDCRAYEAVARARAIDNSIYYVTSIQDTGRSLIIDPGGRILADSAGAPGVVFADVDLAATQYEPWLSLPGATDFRTLWPKERVPRLYREIVAET